METKRKRTFELALLISILSVLMYIVLQYDLIYDSNIRNFRNGTLANKLSGFLWKSLQTTMLDQTTVMTTDSKTVTEGPCSKRALPTRLLRDGTWLPVGTDGHAFVFSAYLVEKNNGEIVIIGVRTRNVSTFYCQVWYERNENASFALHETPARSTVLPEGHGKRYSVVLFMCSVSSSLTVTHVSLVSGRCSSPLNLLLVHHPVKVQTEKRNFTVCLSPLHFQNSHANEFVEWIELNRLLGAEKFIVYNFSSSRKDARILDFYAKQNVVKVVQWRLPRVEGGKTINVHYFGQVAALNDCLYRNKYQSEFIVNLDLDEFIIPHSENVTSWHEMLHQLKRDAVTYIFRNTFFKKEWGNAGVEILNKTTVDKYKLLTLQKLQREKKIFPGGQRSKYFTRPLNVSSVMIHTVTYISKVVVPNGTALVHHYKNWGKKNNDPNMKVTDTTVPKRFGKDLIRKVKDIWAKLDKT